MVLAAQQVDRQAASALLGVAPFDDDSGNVTNARISILTNGQVYKFFTDLEHPNKMDEKAFFEFNILDFRERDVEELKKFAKSAFDVDTILTIATAMIFIGLCRTLMNRQFHLALIRLPETLHPRDRLPVSAGRILGAFREAVTNRVSIGYTLAMTAITGALFGFINSSQQIFADVFDAEAAFPASSP